MRLTCTAIVNDTRQIDNLCQCIEIVGAEFSVKGNTVYADFTGDKETGEKLMKLFEQYPVHGMSILG